MNAPARFFALSICGIAAFALTATGRAEDILVPQIDGDWTTIARGPELGESAGHQNLPVDFALWQAGDQTWQLWAGVRQTSESGGAHPFQCWESRTLTAPDWQPKGAAARTNPTLSENENGLQSPCAIHVAEQWRLFYGDAARLCSATSRDGHTFARETDAGGGLGLFSETAEARARDPFVISLGGQWYCYYTVTQTLSQTLNGKTVNKSIGVVYGCTSPDLTTWSKAKVVAADGRSDDDSATAECPRVVEAAPGHYYLFRTLRHGSEARTLVYHSTDPLDFGHGTLGHVDALHFVTTLPVAAPQIVRQDGQWFIVASRAEAPGIQLARLEWKSVADFQPKLAPKRAGVAIRAALYDDKGSAGQGIPKVSEQLGRCQDIEVTRLNGDGIRAGLDGYDVVIVTGGTSGRQANTIGLLGREQIRRFVQKGGGYVGICAGAYLACDGFSWGVGVLNAKTPSSKWARGIADLQMEVTPEGASVVGLPAEQMVVHYHNGPLLVPGNNPAIPAFEPLAYFRTEVAKNDSPVGIMVNSPAVARGAFGQGRVLVSSPHPEQTPGLENFAKYSVRWAAGAAASAIPRSEFLTQLDTFFTQWDADGNGELSKIEIEKAVTDPALKGKGAAAIAALRRAIRGKTYTLPPLTRAGLAGCVPHRAGDKTQPDLEEMYRTALKRIADVKRELFTQGPPALETLHQGKLGDCFCLAPLGAMLHRNPQEVAAMFTPDGDGRVAVTFGGRDHVTVPLPTDAEIALLASTSATGLWANVYEKAVGQFRFNPDKADERPTALSVVAVGGSAGTIVELVTGKKIVRFSCKPWREAKTTAEEKEKLLVDLRARLTSAMSERKLVCGGVDSGVMLDGRKVPGILGNHAYAVLGYDGVQDVATLWNPHGDNFTPQADPGLAHGYPMRGGCFDVPLAELVEFFGGFSFETAEPH